ncbi:PadR family transcriptional regulator [Humibacter antri]
MKRGDSTRLFLLAELVRRGQAHGHELRREAKIGRTELWTDVGIGSIYSTLRRMNGEGLVEPVRTEREGLLPERTIYTVTEEGRRELHVLRDEFLRTVELPADPFDLGLSVADDVPGDELLTIIDDRVRALEMQIDRLEHQQGAAGDYLDDRDRDLFAHSITRLRAEIAWHHAVRERIAGLGAPGGSDDSATPKEPS